MDALTIIVFLAFALIGENYYSKLKKQIRALQEELYKTRSLLNEVVSEVEVEEIEAVEIESVELPPEIPVIIATQKIAVQSIVPKVFVTPKTEIPTEELPRENELWKKIEEQFSGNFIGVIGTIAIVLGVIFLAVYAAIQTGPIGRFSVICAFSVILYVLHIFLKRKEFWHNISLWLRSASGIIFLVGCLGSIGFESMKWVNDPSMALALLSLGLIINLTLGFLNGGQIFASLHVLLSLLALVVIPLNSTIFFVAAIISTVGILMSYKDKMWDKHIIATSLGFFAIHSYWLSRNSSFPVSDSYAIIFSSLVGLAGILTHYRKTYRLTEINSVALIAHLITWGTFGVNIYVHSKGSSLSTLALGLASVCVFFLSSKAKQHSVGWLLTSDRLISLLLILLAAMSLSKFGVSDLSVSVMVAIISILFLRIISQSADPLLEKVVFNIGCVVSRLAYFIVVVQVCMIAYGAKPGGEVSSIGMIFLSFVILTLVFPKIENKAIENSWGFSISLNKNDSYSTYLGASFGFHGALVTLLALQLKTQPLFLLGPVVIIFATFFQKNYLKNYVFDIASMLCSFIVLILCSYCLLDNSLTISYKVILSLLMIAVSLITLSYNWFEELKEKVVWPGVFGAWVSASLGAYIFTKDHYSMLTGVIWLLIAMLASSVKKINLNRISGTGSHERFDIFILWAGCASIFLFVVRFFLIDIQSEIWLGQVRLRALVEVFSLVVIAYWWFDSRQLKLSETKIFLNYFLELLIALAFVFLIYEIDSRFFSVILIVFSFMSIYLSTKMLDLNRLIIYSFLSYCLALFHVGFMSSHLATPSNFIYDQAWLIALVTILASISYLVFIINQKVYKRPLVNGGDIFGFTSISDWLNEHDAKTLMYPLLISVAFFLTWSFSHSILSLLLIVECFALFLVSIVLRIPNFRIISMSGIAVIFWRIIFYDLVGKDFFIKAVVFITVGAILIIMNVVYNKYKYRFETVKSS